MDKASKKDNHNKDDFQNEINKLEKEIVELIGNSDAYVKNLIFFKLKALGMQYGHDHSNRLIEKLNLTNLYGIEPDLNAAFLDILDVRDK